MTARQVGSEVSLTIVVSMVMAVRIIVSNLVAWKDILSKMHQKWYTRQQDVRAMLYIRKSTNSTVAEIMGASSLNNVSVGISLYFNINYFCYSKSMLFKFAHCLIRYFIVSVFLSENQVSMIIVNEHEPPPKKYPNFLHWNSMITIYLSVYDDIRKYMHSQ